MNPTIVMTKMGSQVADDPDGCGPPLARTPLGRFAGKQHVIYFISFIIKSVQ